MQKGDIGCKQNPQPNGFWVTKHAVDKMHANNESLNNKFKLLKMKKANLLSRAEMRNVIGGGDTTPIIGSGDDCKDECTADSDCTGTYKLCKTYFDTTCNKNVKACTN